MRWLYGILIVLVVLIGIVAFYPDSAPLVRRQIHLLTGYNRRKILLPETSVRTAGPASTVTLTAVAKMIIRDIYTLRAPAEEDWDNFRKRLRQLAAQHPDDAQIQFVHKMLETKSEVAMIAWSKDFASIIWNWSWILGANDLWSVYDSSPLKKLYALRQRFPNNLGLLALLLHCKMSDLVLRRDRTEDISYKRLLPNRTSAVPKRRSNPDAAARMLTLAREGERLEPQNGFFTLMRAIALLEMGRDEEAVQALIEASGKPIWNSYEGWMYEACYKAVRLSKAWHCLVEPEVGYTPLQFMPWILWEPPPPYVRLTRLFVGLAAVHEKRGEWQKGVAIRVALAQLIARMRYERLDINMVENCAHLFRMVGLFPAERASPPLPQADSETQRLAATILRECPQIDEAGARRWGFFLSELQKHGFLREAEWFKRELLANQRTLALTERLHRRVLGADSGWRWWKALERWRAASLSWSLVGALCLWLAFLTVLGGMLTGILQRLRLPDGFIMPLLFALAMLSVLSFVLSDAGTRIVEQIIQQLDQAQHLPHSTSPHGLKQFLITWLPNNPYAIQIGLGVLIFVSLLVFMLLLVLLQQRRVANVVQSVQNALWMAAAGLAMLYLVSLLGYFRTQAHFIENQQGYLLGGREYLMRVVGEPMPAPSPPPSP